MASREQQTASDKTLAVLEALSEHARITDIAHATGLPKPTVHRILQTLVRRGYARPSGDGVYLGGPRMLTVAGRFLQRLDLPVLLRPLLRDLQERTGWTVHLALLSGDEAVYVDKLEGAKPYHLASRVGMGLPLHSTSIGKSILASLPEAEVRQLLSRAGTPSRTANTLTSVDDLLVELRRTRDRGWAEDHEENEAGVCAVGAPVVDHTGRCVGAVSAAALVHHMSAEAAKEHGTLVATTAREISAALGAPAP